MKYAGTAREYVLADKRCDPHQAAVQSADRQSSTSGTSASRMRTGSLSPCAATYLPDNAGWKATRKVPMGNNDGPDPALLCSPVLLLTLQTLSRSRFLGCYHYVAGTIACSSANRENAGVPVWLFGPKANRERKKHLVIPRTDAIQDPASWSLFYREGESWHKAYLTFQHETVLEAK